MTYDNYNQVPWYRQSHLNSIFILVHLLTCTAVPLLLITCIALVTGNIYYNQKDESGQLKTWSTANKVLAFIFLFGPLLAIISLIVSIFTI